MLPALDVLPFHVHIGDAGVSRNVEELRVRGLHHNVDGYRSEEL